MKKLVLFIGILSMAFYAEAQMGMGGRGGGFQRSPMNSQPRKSPDFNVKQAIGLTIYDIDRVLKRISMKDGDENFKKVVSVFNKFNREQRQVLRINSFEFKQSETKVNQIRKDVLENGAPFETLNNAYKEVGTKFKPITDTIKAKEEELDKSLKPLLSKKQFKKWKKLQKKMKLKG